MFAVDRLIVSCLTLSVCTRLPNLGVHSLRCYIVARNANMNTVAFDLTCARVVKLSFIAFDSSSMQACLHDYLLISCFFDSVTVAVARYSAPANKDTSGDSAHDIWVSCWVHDLVSPFERCFSEACRRQAPNVLAYILIWQASVLLCC